jgi:hypothetical protein
MSSCCGNPYVGEGRIPFNPSEVRLYGRPNFCTDGEKSKGGRQAEPEGGKIKLKVGNCFVFIDAGTVDMASIGVIYGYAYEGHCYKLPKPRIMYLPKEPEAITVGHCGCDCGYAPELGYAVWSLDKLARVIALDVRSDDLKTLVLDENMPGNRSPLAYSQTLALAPQRSHE